MPNTYFPTLDEFYGKFYEAVVTSGKEPEFTKKWGLETLADIYDILNNNVQGGIASHRRTMLAAPTAGTVLNIGPGMGFCVFLLAELFDRVLVTEPDSENCAILERIANHYPTRRGNPAHETVKLYQAGISITEEAVNYWNMKRTLMKKRNLKGSILNFTVEGAAELRDVLGEKVNRVYLHKVLSSLSISNTFENIITQAREFLEPGGVITWSEPGYVFEDLLPLEGESLESYLTPVCTENRLQFQVENYILSRQEGANDPAAGENWTLIKAKA